MNIFRPRIVSSVVVAEGARLPKGYGVAWWLPYSDAAYCLPVPLNRIVGAVRNAWLKLKHAPDGDPIFGARRYGHEKGYSEGYIQGYDDGVRHALMYSRDSCEDR